MSGRHKKPRTCGYKLKGTAFKPEGVTLGGAESIALYRDELESFRLCDMDGLTQEEAGGRMGVSRGTVQRILSSARKKVATALAECRAIILEETVCGKK